MDWLTGFVWGYFTLPFPSMTWISGVSLHSILVFYGALHFRCYITLSRVTQL